jgi:prolyl oligopeptidase
MRNFRFFWIALALFVCAASALAAPALPPAAPTSATQETLHGVVVKDPYRYMEDFKSTEVQAWLKAQAAYSREVLDRIGIRESLEKRLTELTTTNGDAISAMVRMPGDRIYYMLRPKGERQFKLAMRTGFKGVTRILVDPEVTAKQTGVPQAINYFKPSWDGKYLAYGMSAGGSEDASLHILEIATGKTIGDPVPRVRESQVSWLPGSRSMTYNQLKAPTRGEPDSELYLDSRVMLHKVGDKADQAKAVFGPTVTRKLGLARLDVATLIFTPGSPWVVARTTDTTLPEGLLFVAKAADLGKANLKWTRISGYEDKITSVELRGDELYFMTYQDAPRKKVMKLDLRKPMLGTAVVVAEPPTNGVMEDFSLTRDSVVGAVRQGTEIVLRRYPRGNKEGDAIPMPFPGAARITDDLAHVYGDVVYTLSGWTQMPLSFVLNGNVSTDTGLRVNPALPRLPDVEVENVEVISHDGAMVPMTLLYKRGMQRNGDNPALLNGYGAFGYSETAGFSAMRMAWIEQGGVLALANVRGSGVYGDTWYRAGQKSTKSNTWKDAVACAQYLIDQKIASPGTLGIMGTSTGGIFAGRAVTTAPQLFAAAIFSVGVLDVVRYEESANGITHISEFGSAKNSREFPALLEMSTYHNVVDGTAYPAVMLVHGMNDPRVDVWHSGKTAARLQAATASGKPILLRLDLQAGHGVGSTATQRNAVAADIYAFLLWQMGKTALKD